MKIKHHLLALSALLLLHITIFARLISLNADGVPYATIPYDFASQSSRWLIYIGDCFKSGYFPLWCPYVAGGTPFFINPQNQLYSPLTLIIGAVFGYSQRTAQLQTVAMLFFGGVGAYLLSYSIWRSRWAALTTAVCFNFTSAVFSNLEHITTINAVTLMPWLFWATTMAARPKKSSWSFLLLAFLIYFLITGGYPGVIAMTFLWLFAYTAYLLYQSASTIGMKLHLGARYTLAYLLGLCLAGVYWIPIFIHRSEFTRGAALQMDQALSGGSLLPKHIWGALFGFMTVVPLPGSDTDISMRGLYFGALAIPLALAALLFIKERIIPALLLLSVGAFLMAWGGAFFGRVALHILLPAFNMSRFPAADSRALMVLGMVVLAGGGAKLLAQKHAGAQSFVSRSCIYLMAALAIGLLAFRAVVDAAAYNNIVVNYITAELFFVALALLTLRLFSGRPLMISILLLLALEMGTCVVANFAIVGQPVSAEAYRLLRASHQRAFTPEAANVPRITTVDNPALTFGEARLVSEEANRGYVEKNFYLGEYNPLRLRRFSQLIATGFTDWMANGKRVVALQPDSRPENYEAFQQQLHTVDYVITAYSPNQVNYQVNADGDSLLVFNEVYFPGWQAVVDGKPEPVIEVCGGLRGLKVAAGNHSIVMSFSPRSFYWGLGISLASIALFLLWAIYVFRSWRALHRTAQQ